MSHVETHVDGRGQGRIIVDGHDLSSVVRCFTVAVTARELPVIELTIPALDGLDQNHPDARVTLPDDVHAALVALGWTPPTIPED